MNREKILDKIQKLLALAKCPVGLGDTEAAMAAATRLMLRHRIEHAELEAAGLEESAGAVVEDLLPPGARSFRTWQSALLGGLCEANGCRLLLSSGRGCRSAMLVCGTPEDVACVRVLFRHCEGEIQRLAQDFRLIRLSHRDKVRSAMASFRFGAALAIGEKALAARDQMLLGNSRALAVVQRHLADLDAWLAEKFGQIGRKKVKASVESMAFEEGRKQGAQVQLGGSRRPSGPAALPAGGTRS